MEDLFKGTCQEFGKVFFEDLASLEEIDDKIQHHAEALSNCLKLVQSNPQSPSVQKLWNGLIRSALRYLLQLNDVPSQSSLQMFMDNVKPWLVDNNFSGLCCKELRELYQLVLKGPWSHPVLQMLIKGSDVGLDELQVVFNDGLECIEHHMRSLYISSMTDQLVIFGRAALAHPQVGKMKSVQKLYQSYVNDLLNEEELLRIMETFDLDVTLEILNESIQNKTACDKLCNASLKYLLEQKKMNHFEEFMTCWIKILQTRHRGTKFFDFLNKIILEEGSLTDSVQQCVALVRSLWKVVGEASRMICVEILWHALQILSFDDPDCEQLKKGILSSIAYFLPHSQVARSCILTIFILHPSIEHYFQVAKTYKIPYQRDKDSANDCKAHLRLTLLEYLQQQWPPNFLQSDSWDWPLLRAACQNMLSDDDVGIIRMEELNEESISNISADPGEKTTETCTSNTINISSDPFNCQEYNIKTVKPDKQVISKKHTNILFKEATTKSPSKSATKKDQPSRCQYHFLCPEESCQSSYRSKIGMSKHLIKIHQWQMGEIHAFYHTVQKTSKIEHETKSSSPNSQVSSNETIKSAVKPAIEMNTSIDSVLVSDEEKPVESQSTKNEAVSTSAPFSEDQLPVHTNSQPTNVSKDLAQMCNVAAVNNSAFNYENQLHVKSTSQSEKSGTDDAVDNVAPSSTNQFQSTNDLKNHSCDNSVLFSEEQFYAKLTSAINERNGTNNESESFVEEHLLTKLIPPSTQNNGKDIFDNSIPYCQLSTKIDFNSTKKVEDQAIVQIVHNVDSTPARQISVALKEVNSSSKLNNKELVQENQTECPVTNSLQLSKCSTGINDLSKDSNAHLLVRRKNSEEILQDFNDKKANTAESDIGGMLRNSPHTQPNHHHFDSVSHVPSLPSIFPSQNLIDEEPSNEISPEELQNKDTCFECPVCTRSFKHRHTVQEHLEFRHKIQPKKAAELANEAKTIENENTSFSTDGISITKIESNQSDIRHARGWYWPVDEFIGKQLLEENSVRYHHVTDCNLRLAIEFDVMRTLGKTPRAYDCNAAEAHIVEKWRFAAKKYKKQMSGRTVSSPNKQKSTRKANLRDKELQRAVVPEEKQVTKSNFALNVTQSTKSLQKIAVATVVSNKTTSNIKALKGNSSPIKKRPSQDQGAKGLKVGEKMSNVFHLNTRDGSSQTHFKTNHFNKSEHFHNLPSVRNQRLKRSRKDSYPVARTIISGISKTRTQTLACQCCEDVLTKALSLPVPAVRPAQVSNLKRKSTEDVFSKALFSSGDESNAPLPIPKAKRKYDAHTVYHLADMLPDVRSEALIYSSKTSFEDALNSAPVLSSQITDKYRTKRRISKSFDSDDNLPIENQRSNVGIKSPEEKVKTTLISSQSKKSKSKKPKLTRGSGSSFSKKHISVHSDKKKVDDLTRQLFPTHDYEELLKHAEKITSATTKPKQIPKQLPITKSQPPATSSGGSSVAGDSVDVSISANVSSIQNQISLPLAETDDIDVSAPSTDSLDEEACLWQNEQKNSTTKRRIDLRKLSSTSKFISGPSSVTSTREEYSSQFEQSSLLPRERRSSAADDSSNQETAPESSASVEQSSSDVFCPVCSKQLSSYFALACHLRKRHKVRSKKVFIPGQNFEASLSSSLPDANDKNTKQSKNVVEPPEDLEACSNAANFRMARNTRNASCFSSFYDSSTDDEYYCSSDLSYSSLEDQLNRGNISAENLAIFMKAKKKLSVNHACLNIDDPSNSVHNSKSLSDSSIEYNPVAIEEELPIRLTNESQSSPDDVTPKLSLGYRSPKISLSKFTFGAGQTFTKTVQSQQHDDCISETNELEITQKPISDSSVLKTSQRKSHILERVDETNKTIEDTADDKTRATGTNSTAYSTLSIKRMDKKYHCPVLDCKVTFIRYQHVKRHCKSKHKKVFAQIWPLDRVAMRVKLEKKTYFSRQKRFEGFRLSRFRQKHARAASIKIDKPSQKSTKTIHSNSAAIIRKETNLSIAKHKRFNIGNSRSDQVKESATDFLSKIALKKTTKRDLGGTKNVKVFNSHSNGRMTFVSKHDTSITSEKMDVQKISLDKNGRYLCPKSKCGRSFASLSKMKLHCKSQHGKLFARLFNTKNNTKNDVNLLYEDMFAKSFKKVLESLRCDQGGVIDKNQPVRCPEKNCNFSSKFLRNFRRHFFSVHLKVPNTPKAKLLKNHDRNKQLLNKPSTYPTRINSCKQSETAQTLQIDDGISSQKRNLPRAVKAEVRHCPYKNLSRENEKTAKDNSKQVEKSLGVTTRGGTPRRLASKEASIQIKLSSYKLAYRKTSQHQELMRLYNKRVIRRVAQALVPAQRMPYTPKLFSLPRRNDSDDSTDSCEADYGPQLACWYCQAMFHCRRNLAVHIVHHIRNIDCFLYRCDSPGCLYGFKTEAELENHKRRHRKKLPHVCLFCPSQTQCFRSFRKLLVHEQKTHSNLRINMELIRKNHCINSHRLNLKPPAKEADIQSNQNEHFLVSGHRRFEYGCPYPDLCICQISDSSEPSVACEHVIGAVVSYTMVDMLATVVEYEQLALRDERRNSIKKGNESESKRKRSFEVLKIYDQKTDNVLCNIACCITDGKITNNEKYCYQFLKEQDNLSSICSCFRNKSTYDKRRLKTKLTSLHSLSDSELQTADSVVNSKRLYQFKKEYLENTYPCPEQLAETGDTLKGVTKCTGSEISKQIINNSLDFDHDTPLNDLSSPVFNDLNASELNDFKLHEDAPGLFDINIALEVVQTVHKLVCDVEIEEQADYLRMCGYVPTGVMYYRQRDLLDSQTTGLSVFGYNYEAFILLDSVESSPAAKQFSLNSCKFSFDPGLPKNDNNIQVPKLPIHSSQSTFNTPSSSSLNLPRSETSLNFISPLLAVSAFQTLYQTMLYQNHLACQHPMWQLQADLAVSDLPINFNDVDSMWKKTFCRHYVVPNHRFNFSHKPNNGVCTSYPVMSDEPRYNAYTSVTNLDSGDFNIGSPASGEILSSSEVREPVLRCAKMSFFHEENSDLNAETSSIYDTYSQIFDIYQADAGFENEDLKNLSSSEQDHSKNVLREPCSLDSPQCDECMEFKHKQEVSSEEDISVMKENTRIDGSKTKENCFFDDFMEEIRFEQTFKTKKSLLQPSKIFIIRGRPKKSFDKFKTNRGKRRSMSEIVAFCDLPSTQDILKQSQVTQTVLKQSQYSPIKKKSQSKLNLGDDFKRNGNKSATSLDSNHDSSCNKKQLKNSIPHPDFALNRSVVLLEKLNYPIDPTLNVVGRVSHSNKLEMLPNRKKDKIRKLTKKLADKIKSKLLDSKKANKRQKKIFKNHQKFVDSFNTFKLDVGAPLPFTRSSMVSNFTSSQININAETFEKNTNFEFPMSDNIVCSSTLIHAVQLDHNYARPEPENEHSDANQPTNLCKNNIDEVEVLDYCQEVSVPHDSHAGEQTLIGFKVVEPMSIVSENAENFAAAFQHEVETVQAVKPQDDLKGFSFTYSYNNYSNEAAHLHTTSKFPSLVPCLFCSMWFSSISSCKDHFNKVHFHFREKSNDDPFQAHQLPNSKFEKTMNYEQETKLKSTEKHSKISFDLSDDLLVNEDCINNRQSSLNNFDLECFSHSVTEDQHEDSDILTEKNKIDKIPNSVPHDNLPCALRDDSVSIDLHELESTNKTNSNFQPLNKVLSRYDIVDQAPAFKTSTSFACTKETSKLLSSNSDKNRLVYACSSDESLKKQTFFLKCFNESKRKLSSSKSFFRSPIVVAPTAQSGSSSKINVHSANSTESTSTFSSDKRASNHLFLNSQFAHIKNILFNSKGCTSLKKLPTSISDVACDSYDVQVENSSNQKIMLPNRNEHSSSCFSTETTNPKILSIVNKSPCLPLFNRKSWEFEKRTTASVSNPNQFSTFSTSSLPQVARDATSALLIQTPKTLPAVSPSTKLPIHSCVVSTSANQLNRTGIPGTSPTLMTNSNPKQLYEQNQYSVLRSNKRAIVIKCIRSVKNGNTFSPKEIPKKISPPDTEFTNTDVQSLSSNIHLIRCRCCNSAHSSYYEYKVHMLIVHCLHLCPFQQCSELCDSERELKQHCRVEHGLRTKPSFDRVLNRFASDVADDDPEIDIFVSSYTSEDTAPSSDRSFSEKENDIDDESDGEIPYKNVNEVWNAKLTNKLKKKWHKKFLSELSTIRGKHFTVLLQLEVRNWVKQCYILHKGDGKPFMRCPIGNCIVYGNRKQLLYNHMLDEHQSSQVVSWIRKLDFNLPKNKKQLHTSKYFKSKSRLALLKRNFTHWLHAHRSAALELSRDYAPGFEKEKKSKESTSQEEYLSDGKYRCRFKECGMIIGGESSFKDHMLSHSPSTVAWHKEEGTLWPLYNPVVMVSRSNTPNSFSSIQGEIGLNSPRDVEELSSLSSAISLSKETRDSFKLEERSLRIPLGLPKSPVLQSSEKTASKTPLVVLKKLSSVLNKSES